MPLSEFEELRSKAAQYNTTKDAVMQECQDEHCKQIEELGCRLLKAVIEINALKEELNKYKSRKWWQFWK